MRAVHADYIRAGAQVIIANTFATSPLLFDALGRSDEVAAIDALALSLAREAREETGAAEVAVAGSFSTMRPVAPGSDRTSRRREWSIGEARPLMRRKAEGLARAGADLIIMEMMRDLDYSLWATEAAVATGLPVWAGLSVERRADGRLAGFGREDWALDDIVSGLMSTGATVCCVMHSSPNDTGEALEAVRRRWSGPLGAYPESGYFAMPDWQFVDIIAPADLLARAREWRGLGATILGGCCGIGPDHIRALSEAFGDE
jgi:S-methylmethionine-dependent homocysteine/selenocysteine methylase